MSIFIFMGKPQEFLWYFGSDTIVYDSSEMKSQAEGVLHKLGFYSFKLVGNPQENVDNQFVVGVVRR